ncbi:discoidin domain-containing protein [Streptacidiphilus sp. P02-A3a]|uniref:discoidin domain-containing protein n=1 Tax=Streptacidiphilus sp. P02-A3a TaxID=2704468 RepID=UPI0015FC0740|nr:discoidin domain-containing protein [Streptacidiphilus sp. P02-A3a]QMU70934.1 choice-of-anchor D domain-containing protein [Streptacidiphilus sp. P02-A3a]
MFLPRSRSGAASRFRRAAAGITAAALMAAAPLLALPATSAAAATTPGATVPFTEYLAQDAATNGTVLAPDYTVGTLASEATGRQAVQLIGQGKYVTFTLTAPANAVDFHYSIPDSVSGGGITAPLSLYVNGTYNQALSLTSQYSWEYGTQATETNTPTIGALGVSTGHDFYNDVRAMFSSTLPAGTKVTLQVDAADTSPWYVINTADFEQVAAPIAQPAGSINVTQAPYNVDNTGVTDVTTALQNAINAGESSGQTVYIPAGVYQISQQLFVNKVTIEGAGEWYTEMTGANVEFAGQIGNPSTNVNISNLSEYGNVNVRNDGDGEVNGINGGFSNSSFSNMWIQNTKVGAWIVGPSTNLTLTNMRIQDTTADGINFDGGVTDSTVSNSFLRNTQDDGLAIWSQNTADANDTFTQNTVDSPGVANNIGLYGGTDNTVTNNLLQDTVTRGGGINIGNRYSPTPLAGTTTITGNKLVRTGQFDPGWDYGVGAIWFWPQNESQDGTVNISNNEIDDSPYEAFQFQNSAPPVGAGVNTQGSSGNTITNVNLTNNTVNGVGTYVLQDQAPGSVSISGLVGSNVGVAGVMDCGSGLTITQGSGNSGWSTTACGMPATWPLIAYPSTTTFEQAAVGTATPAQKVTIMNSGSAAATLGTISASSGFTVTNDPSQPCGTSLDATTPTDSGNWCQVDVSFTAPASGITTGTLTIPTNQPGNPTVLQLVGSTGGTNVITPPTLSPTALSFGDEAVGSSTPAQTVTLTNPGATAITIGSIAVNNSSYTQTNTCGSTLAAGASCTVAVTFAPSAGGAQNATLAITNSGTSTPIGATLSGTGVTATTNLAAGAAFTASSSTGGFPPSNANDGNASTYWESTDGSFPQWLQADLGSTQAVGSLTLDLPPATSWATRTETLSVQGSNDGSTWTTLVGSAGYTFNPATGNTVGISLPSGTSDRYLRLNFTANTGWSAAQLSELEIFPGGSTSGGGGGSTTPSLSASTSGLTFAQQTVGSSSPTQTVSVTNGGSAAAAISKVATTGDFSQTNTCGSSLASGASCTVSVTFTPTATGNRTGSLTVASNDPASPLTVGLSGTGAAAGSVNLALGATLTASGSTQGYLPSNANDGNTSSYWESTDNAFPQWLQADLGSTQTLGSITLDLPPATAWSTRTETLSVQGSTDGSTWTTLVASAGYTFNPATGNTVSVNLPSGTSDRYLRLNFTGNTGWPAGQLSEFEIFS